MNFTWQDFLVAQGAQIANDVVQNFGQRPAEQQALLDQTILCDLAQVAELRVTGDDAQTFLSNMMSSDVNALAVGQAQYSSFNTAKGRVLATLLIVRDEVGFALYLPRELIAAIHKKLSMYVFRSKVKIVDVSAQTVRLGVAGQTAPAVLAKIFGELPVANLSAAFFQQSTVLRVSGQRFQLSLPLEIAQKIWSELTAQAKPVGADAWDWFNIRDGIPTVLAATQEQFVLQMINLDLIGGVSFNKGCYPGQEIVARMHYLGKLKRRMYLAHIDSELAPQAGDELFSAEMAGQASGMIVNASAAPTGGFDVLAVLQIASHDTQTIHLGNLQGATLAFDALPYALS